MSEDSKSQEVPPQAAAIEDAPDPDEDDLSDLDDVLDEFAATKLDSKPLPTSSGPGRPPTAPSASDPLLPFPDDDEFAKQLQAGMADLLGELHTSPEMQKQFEDLVKELGEAATANPTLLGPAPPPEVTGSSKAAAEDAAAKAEASFQETIRKTMERMQTSSEAAGQAAAQSSEEDDFLAAMLKEMEKGGAEGLGSEEDFSKLLFGMMEQLTNKEILYEPMKELHDKFPAWMEANKDKVKPDDLKRYQEQQTLVREIVGKFEEAGYTDERVDCREYIVERMQKMQAAGSPPPDLVGDMNAAQEALGDIDAGCPQQ
ncbi:Pex19-domain-containing protein [Trichodelitschia bisporula]|uniref:Pex19-domain-containing protein n=1 Tax=Trichodelitschia bisporula TaxID=703511 RepID=A0A6G1HTR1_9PEZI|nr:Pex19-domain-containing protein [Trichodelitschia bisporula]